MCTAIKHGRARGVTLIELIAFIVIVSVAVVGVLTALDLANRSSTDPMIHKQALGIAEALLEEVQLQPFTYCDPDDANAATAADAAGCTGGANGSNDENRLTGSPPLLRPETGEARTGPTLFDNVSDYNTLCMGAGCSTPSPITDLSGAAIAGLEGFTAEVRVVNQALGTAPAPVVPSSDAVLITVTVTGPANTKVVLDGYRVRYAPNALP